jgi:hypothetical protein
MSNRTLIARFEEWRQCGKPLALATVIHTEGSTYSKAGRQILITAKGEHAGLVSGGCLEGDLAEHACDVIKTGTAKLIHSTKLISRCNCSRTKDTTNTFGVVPMIVPIPPIEDAYAVPSNRQIGKLCGAERELASGPPSL